MMFSNLQELGKNMCRYVITDVQSGTGRFCAEIVPDDAPRQLCEHHALCLDLLEREQALRSVSNADD